MIYRSSIRGARKGLTLIEVITATAVFALSLVAIQQLFNLSTDQAMEVRERSRAARLAQSKLSEYVAGVRSLQGGGSSGDFEDEGEPAWSYEVSAEADSTANGLYKVTVTVSKDSTKVTLSQYVFDPKQRGVILGTQTQSSGSTTNQGSTTTNQSTTTNTNTNTNTATTTTNTQSTRTQSTNTQSTNTQSTTPQGNSNAQSGSGRGSNR